MANDRKRLKELAYELDLSITTISRALGGHSDVSVQTRQRVREAARRAGYVPSRAARMLVSGRSDFVGLVVPLRGPTLVDAFLGDFITGLGRGLHKHGRDLIIAPSLAEQNEFDVLRHLCEDGRADGLVLSRIELADPRVSHLIDAGYPFVAHGRSLSERQPYAFIDTDGEGAFLEAVSRLAALGHRHFALLTIDEPMTFAAMRRQGYALGLLKAGLSPEAFRSAPRFDAEAVMRAAHSLLSRTPRPTAVLAVTDDLALAVLKAAAERGIAVPDELSVIGFDNLAAGAHANPALSTFEPHVHDTAEKLAEMLVRQIEEGPRAIETVLIKADFVGRGSHGPAPRAP